MPDLFDAGEALGPLNAVMPEGLHPTLREMVEEMFLHLLEDEEAVALLGVERLAELVVGQVDRVAGTLGGCSFYLPRGIGPQLSARNRQIVEQYNGRNKHYLAMTFGIFVCTYSAIFICSPMLIYLGLRNESAAPARDEADAKAQGAIA